MPNVASVVVDRLCAAGLRTLFGVPGGGSNLDLVEAAVARGMRFVLTATETAAALAAVGHAEATAHPAACLTTLGPGAASVVNGVACAFLDRAPVIAFTDSHPASSAGRYEHQRVDQAALLAPVTKWRTTLRADGPAALIAEAIERAVAPRPGPVHVDCPGDVAGLDAAPCDSNVRPARPTARHPEAETQTEFASLERLLSRARRPLILVGLGARAPVDVRAIRALCSRRRVPALVTYKAKGIVPDGDPMFAGVFTNARIESAAIESSDLLVGIGLDPVELIPRPWAYSQPIVYCGRSRVEDGHVPFAAQVIGDIETIVERFEPHVRSEWDPAEVQTLVQEQRAALLGGAVAMGPQRAVLVAATAAPDARVVVDAGAHMFPATMLWPVGEANGMLISNGLSTMGFAVPAAIGAALADPTRRIVVVTGDGGLLMCVGELLTAARERLRITVVVFSDDALSLIEIKQQARQLQPAGVHIGAVRWAPLAESVGVAGFCARTEPELARAVDAAQAIDGPALVDARIDRSAYPAIMKAIRG